MARIQSSSPETNRRMVKVRQKSSGADVAVRHELYRRGLHYRVDFEVLKKPHRVADIAFQGRRIAVFVDGCLWRAYPEHATWPKQNAEFWRQKIEANRLRDAATNSRLFDAGWTVLRFWEHQTPIDAAEAIAQTVAKANARCCTSPASAHKKN
jgi:DNA mismatch endonuclease (patch repair protein)